ncbi:MAG: phage integrase SAM-like domain-containing protein [Clostridia bacterium]|nr:phage integrase SAM-like domain-containing protein [Clostridia bacterium]
MKKLKILSVRDITFKEGCELYLDNCRERNLREGTIEHYKNSYKQLYKFFNPNMPISQINSDMYKKYVLYLRERISNDVSITFSKSVISFKNKLYNMCILLHLINKSDKMKLRIQFYILYECILIRHKCTFFRVT